MTGEQRCRVRRLMVIAPSSVFVFGGEPQRSGLVGQFDRKREHRGSDGLDRQERSSCAVVCVVDGVSKRYVK